MMRTIRYGPSSIGRLLHARGRRLLAAAVAVVFWITALPALTASAQRAPAATPNKYFSTTLNYSIRFYPRFETWFLQQYAPKGKNRIGEVITGPSGIIGPKWLIAPGPNVDTVYAAVVNADLSEGPQILTIPPTTVRYSVANVNVWGDYAQPIPPGAPGAYALTLPSWKGTLPPGVTRIDIPFRNSQFILRADRYTMGVNTVAAAKAFVGDLHFASLPAYRKDPSTGKTILIPQALFGGSGKVANDDAMQYAPTRYLQTLQTALRSPTTTPFTASDRALSRAFNTVFAAAQQAQARGNYGPMSQIVSAVHTAYAMVVNHYMSHTTHGTEWIYFNDAGQFGTNYLDRAAVCEFLFGINTPKTALYYDAFTDAKGLPLDAATFPFYRITFPKADIPDAIRFWSLTLYEPPGISLFAPHYPLVPTKNVASYMPLVKNPNGSITVYIQPRPPANPSLKANWLPTPAHGPFSMVLRVYGPTGNTENGLHYVPPPIKPLGVLGNGHSRLTHTVLAELQRLW